MAKDNRLIVMPTDVTEVTDGFERVWTSNPQWGRNATDTIGDEIDAIAALSRQNAAQPHNYEISFRFIGACALGLLKQTPNAWNRNHFALMLLGKHEAYGAAPLTKWGPIGVVIRISSKFERYKNLSNNAGAIDGGVQREESLEDTLRDIIGYCVLGHTIVTRKEQGHGIDTEQGH